MTEGGASTSRTLRLIVQLIGFVVALLLLGWTVRVALSEENRAQLERLGEATPGEIVGLMALSAVYVVLNGLTFWAVLWPERRLKPLDVIAVNGLSTFMAYLPFKMSIVTRVIIHNRRDGVPVLTIGAWTVAVAALMLATVAPLGLVSAWRQRVDALWVVLSLGGVAACVGLVLGVSTYFAGERGLARIHVLFDRLGSSLVNRALRSEPFARLHSGFGMLAHPRAVWCATGLRLLDLAAQGGRFWIAAAVLGTPIGADEAMLMGVTYFLVGAVSPVGQLGTREAATVALAAAMGVTMDGRGAEGMAAVALFITGTESVVLIFGAGFAAAWLRADRLLTGRRAARNH